MKRLTRPLARAALAAFVLATAAVLAACDRGTGGAAGAAAPKAAAPHFNAVDLTGADYAKDFHLPDPDGTIRSLADYRGRDVVVFFGYTHCPDVCPTTMADLAAAKKAMGADGAKVQVVFVTIDPQRDTAALLKSYTEGFGPDFVGLRGDDAQTKAVAREFRVFYAKVPGKTPDDYTMDHTAGSYVFDPAGHVRLFVRNGATPEAMAEDLKALLAEGAART